MIGIIKIGVGNIASLINLFEEIGYEAEPISESKDILNYSTIVLPGVGSFDQAMIKLEEKGFIQIILNAVKNNQIRIFGICLGMQILFDSSAEGKLNGLGILKGKFERFKTKRTHMGWNTISPEIKPKNSRFYFVHNYAIKKDSVHGMEIFKSNYNGESFISMVKSSQILATQFHPEKSGEYGISLIKNWLNES